MGNYRSAAERKKAWERTEYRKRIENAIQLDRLLEFRKKLSKNN